MKCAAIVLAAGSGKRMGTSVKKQYLEIDGMPVVAYSLLRFQKQSFIDEIILVTGEREWCRREIVEKYGISKVKSIIPGGKERYDSVRAGLLSCGDAGIVFIHDGARPFISDELLERLYADVRQYGACIAAVPVKDTIKVSDAGQMIRHTPDRRLIWQAQTPQVFSGELIRECYRKALEAEEIVLTDDASCVELYGEKQVHLTMGSYENIKITTPEDLKIAAVFADVYKIGKI